jgi:predicted RNase H-like nuclease (RuvC/YqgF family)
MQERQKHIAAAQALQATLVAASNLKDNPRKKELLDEATKVEGKVGDANKKVGQRGKARDVLQQELAVTRKKIADAEEAAGKADAAIQSKGAQLQQQRSRTQRAYADKALKEKDCQELGSHINRLQGEAVSRQGELKQLKFENKQLAKFRKQLQQRAKEFGVVVVLGAVAGAGAGVGVAAAAAAGAGVGAAAGVGAGAGAGVMAHEGEGSTASVPLPAAAWPSLAVASSSPVKAPRAGR